MKLFLPIFSVLVIHLFLSALYPAFAQITVASIRFTGNVYFSERELRELIPATPGSESAGIAESRTLLQRHYAAAGFYSFRIDSLLEERVDSAVAVHFFLTEGVRSLVSEISVAGNVSIPSDRLLSGFETEVGSPLDPAALERDIRSMLHLYSENGFPLASINSSGVETEPGAPERIRVLLVVSEGAAVTIDEIRITGNGTTDSEVIIRELRWKQGEPFREQRLTQMTRRLERMQLFSSVSPPELFIVAPSDSGTQRGGIRWRVKEGANNSFDGIAGYVPAVSPSTKGYFTGNIFVAMRNLFGSGRKALIRWQRETDITQELELQYREPWLYGYPLNAGGTFFQRKQDSSYVKTRFELRLEWPATDELTLSGNFTTESVIPGADRLRFTVFESELYSFGAELLFDTRNDLRNPSEGVRYAAAVRRGTKSITGPPQFLTPSVEREFGVQRYTVDAEMYFSPFLRNVVLIAFHGKQITGSRLEVSDLFPFGGTTSVRGYRENQFFASQIAYITAEYRFLSGRASSFFVFADGGYFSRPSDPLRGTSRQERSVYGYGTGARIETGLGIMNVTFALGEGDSFSTGKIHVGIINEF